MKIYNRIKFDIDTWEVLEEDSFDYSGPLLGCDATSSSSSSLSSSSSSRSSSSSSTSWVPFQNLTTYSLVDPEGHIISISPVRATVDKVLRAEELYLTYDFGSNFFGDFRIYFDYDIEADVGTGSAGLDQQLLVAAFSNNPSNTWQDLEDANEGLACCIRKNNEGFSIYKLVGRIKDFDNDNNIIGANLGDVTGPAHRWVTFERIGTTARFYIYNDSGRTSLKTSYPLVITCETTAYRYFTVLASWDTSTSNPLRWMKGYVQNYEFSSSSSSSSSRSSSSSSRSSSSRSSSSSSLSSSSYSFRCYNELDVSSYGVGGSGVKSIAVDTDQNLYVYVRNTEKIHKNFGVSDRSIGSFDLPAQYNNAAGYSVADITFTNGKLAAIVFRNDPDIHRYLEFDQDVSIADSTAIITKDLVLDSSVSGALWGSPRTVAFDENTGYLVGTIGAWNSSGGYRERIIKWDYNTGDTIPFSSITSTPLPFTNSGIWDSFSYNERLYLYYIGEQLIRSYNPNNVTMNNGEPAIDTIELPAMLPPFGSSGGMYYDSTSDLLYIVMVTPSILYTFEGLAGQIDSTGLITLDLYECPSSSSSSRSSSSRSSSSRSSSSSSRSSSSSSRSSSSSSSSSSLSSSSSSASSSSRSSSSSSSITIPEQLIFGENDIADVSSVTTDAYISQEEQNLNYGQSGVLKTNRTQEADLQSFLIRFDISYLDSLLAHEVQIERAMLWLKSTENASGVDVSAFKLLKSWSPGTGDGDIANSGEVTWKYRTYDTSKWSIEGASKTNFDIEAAQYGKNAISDANTWYSWNVTRAIKDFFTDGDNYGFLLRFPRSGGRVVFGANEFYSSEATGAGDRPYLILNLGGPSISSSSSSRSSSSSSSSLSSSSSSSRSSSSSSRSSSRSSSSSSGIALLGATTAWIYGTSGNVNTARQVATGYDVNDDELIAQFRQLGDWWFFRTWMIWDLSGTNPLHEATDGSLDLWTTSNSIHFGSAGIVLVKGKTGWEGEGGGGGNIADNFATWYWPGPGAETYWEVTSLSDVIGAGVAEVDGGIKYTWTFNAAGLAYITSVVGVGGYLELLLVSKDDADNTFNPPTDCNMHFHSERSATPAYYPALNLVLQEPT